MNITIQQRAVPQGAVRDMRAISFAAARCRISLRVQICPLGEGISIGASRKFGLIGALKFL